MGKKNCKSRQINFPIFCLTTTNISWRAQKKILIYLLVAFSYKHDIQFNLLINIRYPYSAHICTRSSFANFETVYHYRDWCTTNNPKYEFWQKLKNLKSSLPTLGATSSSTLHITKYQDQRDHLVGQSTILAAATLPPPGWKDPNLIPTFSGEFR